MRRTAHLLGAMVVGGALALVACSPEDGRERGERGADTDNRPRNAAEVELRGRTNPVHNVPEVGRGVRIQEQK